jgi:hypothetical protein
MATAIKKPISFNIPAAPERSSYSFPKGYYGGMNTSVKPDQIADNETPDVKNMELRNGIWCKRYGFKRVNATSWGAHPIRGMYEYWKEGASTPIVLVAWNGKLYSYNESTDTSTDLMTGTKTGIADTLVTFFTMNGICYFFTGTEYCQYDGINPVAVVTGYVPVVVQGRSPDGTTVAGTSNEELNYLSNSWKESFSGTVSDTAYVLQVPGLLDIKADSIEHVWVNGTELSSGFTLSTDGKTVNFDTAPGEGDNNVIIQPTYSLLNDPTAITKCTIAQEWGGKSDTRIFITGNPDISNRRWYCDLLNPTYFPINNYDDVGSNAEKHKGFGRLYDYQVNYKERSMYYSYVGDVDSTTGTISFPVLPMNDQYGCSAPRTICPAQNGLLAFSDDGVTFTVASFVRGQLNVIPISDKVNHNDDGTGLLDFTQAEREAAFAYIYDQKYWLHIKDVVWILDLRYSNLQGAQYCWYLYDGTPGKASCFIESDNLLYMGDDSAGLIYRKYNKSDATPFRDDGSAIDAWWTSPMIFGGARDWIKKFRQLNITFGGQVVANHLLTFITDDGLEDISISYQDTRAFDYGNVDYSAWTYGSNPYPSTEPEKIGYKGEYIQWKIRNSNLDENLEILAQNLIYSLAKRIK